MTNDEEQTPPEESPGSEGEEQGPPKEPGEGERALDVSVPHEVAQRESLSPGASVTEQTFSYQSGPLPPGSEVIRYGQADPTLPDRIMKMAEAQQRMAERQQQHDHHGVDRVLAHTHRIENRGQWFAFFLATCSVAVGLYFLFTGVAIDRTTLVLGPGFVWLLVSLCLALIRARRD